MREFPKGFLFGAASAAYQVEGSIDAEGKGPSIWDDFCSRPGKVKRGESGATACDSYRRPREDVEACAAIGLGAYRFSISWPRVQPAGRGAVNEAGLDYYDRLVDALLERGVEPWPTVFHWDLPLALQRDIGGFRDRRIVGLLGDYAEILARRLGDRVRNWFSVNEPFEFAAFGHLLGAHAPGLRSPAAFFAAMHHMLLGHAEAAGRIRSLVPGARVGPALSWTPVHPARDSARDRAAAGRAEAFMNRITFDPLLLGRYPEAVARARPWRPPVREGDLEAIRGSADFVGLNYYSRERARANFLVPLVGADISGKEPRDIPGDETRTAMGWEVYPEGLSEILGALRADYGNPPVYVTENGAAYADEPGPDGRIDDRPRIAYVEAHLGRALREIAAGSDLRGWFYWSLVDNFEWAEGMAKKFGLYALEPGSLRRVPKASAFWYGRVAREGALHEAAAREGEAAGRAGTATAEAAGGAA